MGYNTSWQLGYECQSRCNMRAEKLGQKIKYLRKLLNAFPRYSSSLIVGPDVIAFKTNEEKQYLLDYFNSIGSALSAITWHPNFDQVSFNNNKVIIRDENLFTEKANLEKAAGEIIFKKPLWIAESKEEKCKKQFIGALVWTRRLGNSAKIGAQVVMRQPENSNLFKPTPDFWVSLLHKNLVGSEVLDINVEFGNETHIHFFCQCTKPSLKYKKGSLTIFGINLTPNPIIAKLKDFKIKEVDEYILLPGFDNSNRMFAESTLLNNKLLTLNNGHEIPHFAPIVKKDDKNVPIILPSGGIGFWVVPNLKFKVCGFHEETIKNRSRRGTKIENSSENITPTSRKRVRDIFRTLESNTNTIQNQNPSPPTLKLTPIIIPTVLSPNDQLKQKLAIARIKLRTIFQDLQNSIKHHRPLAVKRETVINGETTPLTKFKQIQQNQQVRNAEIVRKIRESIKQLEISDTLKNTLGERKLKQFIDKSDEELEKLRSNLRKRQEKFVENYRTRSGDFSQKLLNDDFKSRVSKIVGVLQEKERGNSHKKRETEEDAGGEEVEKDDAEREDAAKYDDEQANSKQYGTKGKDAEQEDVVQKDANQEDAAHKYAKQYGTKQKYAEQDDAAAQKDAKQYGTKQKNAERYVTKQIDVEQDDTEPEDAKREGTKQRKVKRHSAEQEDVKQGDTEQGDVEQKNIKEDAFEQDDSTQKNAEPKEVKEDYTNQKDAGNDDAEPKDAKQDGVKQKDDIQEDANQKDADQQDATRKDARQEDATQKDAKEEDAKITKIKRNSQQDKSKHYKPKIDKFQQNLPEQEGPHQSGPEEDGPEQSEVKQNEPEQNAPEQAKLTEDDELLSTFTSFFKNFLHPTEGQTINNPPEQTDPEDTTSNDEYSSEEDENWNHSFVAASTTTADATDDNKNYDDINNKNNNNYDNIDNNNGDADDYNDDTTQKYFRKRRDTESDETDYKSSKSHKKVKENYSDNESNYYNAENDNDDDMKYFITKRRKNKNDDDDLDETYSPNYNQFTNFRQQWPNYWNYRPLIYYDYYAPYGNYHHYYPTGIPSYSAHFDYGNSVPYHYYQQPFVPLLRRRRRQIDDIDIKNTDKGPIDNSKLINSRVFSKQHEVNNNEQQFYEHQKFKKQQELKEQQEINKQQEIKNQQEVNNQKDVKRQKDEVNNQKEIENQQNEVNNQKEIANQQDINNQKEVKKQQEVYNQQQFRGVWGNWSPLRKIIKKTNLSL
ncbi:uncharacterized protein DDB_G0283697-like [Leptopilina heterotoma]|uniref:uncharacterized protein DDB_G0283697-like n=1 Tax=Leptopilina heterotoma TaxID=63436 RepID=UPI001CA84B23|nr:uncharacterized protein DDB_G0283697-like [Leptopilina heterotoma]